MQSACNLHAISSRTRTRPPIHAHPRPSPDLHLSHLFASLLPSSRHSLLQGFDWKATISPILPGCPEWCPATHFGYLESGEMGVKMKDGSTFTVKAGTSYLIPPGHLPVMDQDAVMVEFSQDPTYTNKEVMDKMK